MSERGEYRAIYTVIVDGPDFQAFAPEAKLVFYTLKLSLGATGIDVIRALVPTLVEQTGYDDDTVEQALCQLEDADWIRREHNVVWIVRGFEFEPSLTHENINHRKSVQRHIDGLPNVGLVDLFRSRYARWFDPAPKGSGTDADGMAKGSEGDQKATAITKDLRLKTEDLRTSPRKTPRGGDAGKRLRSAREPEVPPEFEAAWQDYPKRAGSNSKRDALKAWLARRREGVSAETMHSGVRRYAAFCEDAGKVGTEYVMQATRFFGRGGHYAESWNAPTQTAAIPPAQPRASPFADEYAAFDDLMRAVDRMGGYRNVPPEWHAAQSEPVRRAISAVGGLPSLANADEIGLRIKRKTFAEALAAAAHDTPREATA